jgi:hypothetical protein
VNDLKVKETWILAPVSEAYPIEKGVMVAPVHHLLDQLLAKGG